MRTDRATKSHGKNRKKMSALFRLLFFLLLMAVDYNQTATGAGAGNIAACSTGTNIGTQSKNSLCTEGGSAGGAVTVGGSQLDIGTGRACVYMEIVPPSDTGWASGNWTVRLNVTTANSLVTWTDTYICRLNSSNVSQATIGSLTGQSISLGSTGVKTMTVSGSAQTPNAGDKVYIVIIVSVVTTNNQSFGITWNQAVSSPFTKTTTLTASKATLAFTAKTATFQTIVPPSQTATANFSILDWPVRTPRALLYPKTPEAEAAVTTLTASKGSLAFGPHTGAFKESFPADKSSLSLTPKVATFSQVVLLTANKSTLTFTPHATAFRESLLSNKATALSFTPHSSAFREGLLANKSSITFTGKDASFTGVTAQIPIFRGLFHFELPYPLPGDSIVAFSVPDFYPFGRIISLDQKRHEARITIAVNLATPLQADILTASKGSLSFSAKPSLFRETLLANKQSFAFTPDQAVFRQALLLTADKGTMILTPKQAAFIEKLLAVKGTLVLSPKDFHALEGLLANHATLTLVPKAVDFNATTTTVLTADKAMMFMSPRDVVFGGAEAPTELRKIISLVEDHLTVVKG